MPQIDPSLWKLFVSSVLELLIVIIALTGHRWLELVSARASRLMEDPQEPTVDGIPPRLRPVKVLLVSAWVIRILAGLVHSGVPRYDMPFLNTDADPETILTTSIVSNAVRQVALAAALFALFRLLLQWFVVANARAESPVPQSQWLSYDVVATIGVMLSAAARSPEPRCSSTTATSARASPSKSVSCFRPWEYSRSHG